ncbi:MAG TPA: hypothetical protein VHM91_06055 [Verrucomicrobiales bacterium]|nr:hypothetical protein [Verrucomicrobiales bacterium]
MSWKASRADKDFSGVRTVSDAVQPEDHGLPPCCARTRIVLKCRHDERGFTYNMPVKGRSPWLSPDVPPQNRKWHVMADNATPVFQVVSSSTHEAERDVINIRAEGPGECPPGTPSVLTVTPNAGAAEVLRLPLRDWKVPVPSSLTSDVLNADKPWERPGLHPFCLPDLPARTWVIAFPACPAKGLGMSVYVKSFPGVLWSGQARVQAQSSNGPARPVVEGGITLRVDGRERLIDDWRSLRAIFPFMGMIDDLTKTVNAVNELCSPLRSRGLDSSRLQWREPLRWDPMPSMSIQVESRLFEQTASGLLGHFLDIKLNGEPLAGATGEANVLPVLFTNATAEKRLKPITGGHHGGIAELSTRYGIYLVAQGRSTVIASLRSARPIEPIAQRFLSHGEVNFALEGRSESEFESLVVSSTSATSAAEGARLAVELEAPPDSPLPEPRARKVKAQAAFTGMVFHSMERHSGGVRIRPWQPPPPGDEEPPPPQPVNVLPARMWPQGTEPGKTEEIPWCHE